MRCCTRTPRTTLDTDTTGKGAEGVFSSPSNCEQAPVLSKLYIPCAWPVLRIALRGDSDLGHSLEGPAGNVQLEEDSLVAKAGEEGTRG